MTPSQTQQLDKIREDWKPGARLTTWGPKDAAESINFLLAVIDSKPSDRVETWYVVFRDGQKPVSAFPVRKFAEGWKSECPHRLGDTIAARKLTFKGIDGYETP